jgi:hypothetical protein
MSTVCAGDIIVAAQCQAGAYGHRFFPNVRVQKADSYTTMIELLRGLLKTPDTQHVVVHLAQQGFVWDHA